MRLAGFSMFIFKVPFLLLFVKTSVFIFALSSIWSCTNAHSPVDNTKPSSASEDVLKAQTGLIDTQDVVKSFSLNDTDSIQLVVNNATSPTLQIAHYTTGPEQLNLVVGSLIATGAGLVFVAPLATVPAAVGPLANTAAGAGATGVALGEAKGIDSLLGRGRAKIFKDVVTSIDLTAILKDSLERFLNTHEESRERTSGKLEVTLAGYGFKTSQGDDVCCFIDVLTSLDIPEHISTKDRVLIGWDVVGDDIPPAYCTGLKRFLDQDGLLARQAFRESAEIAAAVIAQRLRKGGW